MKLRMNGAKARRHESTKARREKGAKTTSLYSLSYFSYFSCFRAFTPSRLRAFALVAAILCFSCQRRPLEGGEVREMARIRVHIDWSHSGISVPSYNEAERIHRVSFRFFPEDGSPAFDRYLEKTNVTDGWIDVPIGKYSVVVFNESVYDAAYWSDAVFFTGVESYAAFAAHAVVYDPAQLATDFPFYTPPPGESVIIGPEPRKLASWSLDHFEVTGNMAQSSGRLSLYEEEMLDALKSIRMRRLTRMVNVTAQVTNLVSTLTHYCTLSGFANTVYMASGEATQTPSISLFKLNGRQYDPDGRHGTTRCSFLSFGRVPQAESYTLAVDVLYVTGERYLSDPPLIFDVTGDVVSGPGPDLNIAVNYGVEYREGGIAVNDWGEDYVYNIN